MSNIKQWKINRRKNTWQRRNQKQKEFRKQHKHIDARKLRRNQNED